MNILEISKSSSAITEFSFFSVFFSSVFGFFSAVFDDERSLRDSEQSTRRCPPPVLCCPLVGQFEYTHSRRLPPNNGGDCPREKNSSQGAALREIGPSCNFFSVSLFCAENYICSYENQQKLLSPELHFLTPIYTKSFARWGFAPDPLGELIALPQTS